MLAIPLLSFALWSGGIGAAAHAAEPGKDASAGGLPRILVLATGGTIAGQADARARANVGLNHLDARIARKLFQPRPQFRAADHQHDRRCFPLE